MPSLVWGRSPQEAYENPYEFEAQTQFIREADVWLQTVMDALQALPVHFERNEESLDKASWMLARDLVESLIEAKSLLQEGRYRAGSRFFRDCIETIDLLQFLHSSSSRKMTVLQDWYANNPIDHSELIRQLELDNGKAVAKGRADLYQALSAFAHKTYKHLLHGYSESGDGALIKRSEKGRVAITPQMVAADLAVLAALFREAGNALTLSGVLNGDIIQEAWITALEEQARTKRFSFKII